MPKLSGITAISKYTGRSECTIMSQIQTMDFPAVRNNDNVWESDTEAVEQWREGLGKPEPAPVKNKRRGRK